MWRNTLLPASLHTRKCSNAPIYVAEQHTQHPRCQAGKLADDTALLGLPEQAMAVKERHKPLSGLPELHIYEAKELVMDFNRSKRAILAEGIKGANTCKHLGVDFHGK